ncbi:uncharacterized protein [Typha latifolia]|uniref:uncharacterized protein n=1 Tax=Typha latifolia TaxID=4733 RepID=UPI003C2F9DAC
MIQFGTGSTLHQTPGTGQLEDQKRKARAERFGLATHSTVDEEAKKKARLARFAQNPKIDSLEEEKRKARAARFGEASTASSQANGKDEFEQKAATVASNV